MANLKTIPLCYSKVNPSYFYYLVNLVYWPVYKQLVWLWYVILSMNNCPVCLSSGGTMYMIPVQFQTKIYESISPCHEPCLTRPPPSRKPCVCLQANWTWFSLDIVLYRVYSCRTFSEILKVWEPVVPTQSVLVRLIKIVFDEVCQ